MDLAPTGLDDRSLAPTLDTPTLDTPGGLTRDREPTNTLPTEGLSPDLVPFAAGFNQAFEVDMDGRVDTPTTAYMRFSDLALADPEAAIEALPDLGAVRDPALLETVQGALERGAPGTEAVLAGQLQPGLAEQDRRVLTEDFDDVVPIVFPDYEISVMGHRVPHLGHAGVLLIDDETGLTKYYEYGRYDSPTGEARQRTVPNVEIDPETSRPTPESLARVLRSISVQSGQNGDIRAAYIDNAANFDAMQTYADERVAERNDPDREPYQLFSHNCNTFMRDVAEAGGVDMPWIISPRPIAYIDRVRGDFLDLDYDAETRTATITD
ncbi:MAG: hypothetical protein AAF845_10210 [Bacteroidota bacterium]